MRVLTVGNMYPPHHLGGYELTWRSSVEQLRAAGHEVAVLTTGFRRDDPDPAFPEDPQVSRELRWYWHDHEFPRMWLGDRLKLERHNKATLAKEIDAFRPDAVCWWAMGGMSLALIEQVRQAGIPAVGVVGDDWMVYGPRVDGWTRFLRRLRLHGPRFDDVIWLFNSAATRDAAGQADGRVVHPGVDTTLFGAHPPHDWAWRLLYVGRIDPRKGIDAAVEVMAALPPEATLTVLGAGEDAHRAELGALCARLGLEDRVTFGQRPRDELPAAYAAADAVLFPVRWAEPWGLVPLEAMTVGTPVVASGRGGSGEYLRDGQNALVCEPEPEALAGAVQRLAGDAALRARLRDGGVQTAAPFTERDYNEAIEAALAEAVA